MAYVTNYCFSVKMPRTFASCVLSYKFTLDELYSMKALVTRRAESYKDWLINVQEILENKGSKKKGQQPKQILPHRLLYPKGLCPLPSSHLSMVDSVCWLDLSVVCSF